jgi:hypothetical protein
MYLNPDSVIVHHPPQTMSVATIESRVIEIRVEDQRYLEIKVPDLYPKLPLSAGIPL